MVMNNKKLSKSSNHAAQKVRAGSGHVASGIQIGLTKMLKVRTFG